MVIDQRGDLWIIQRGYELHSGLDSAPSQPATIRCYRPDGTSTGRVISDVIDPRSLAYDAAKDQLVVGENGPDLDVRFYDGLASAPRLSRTFGAKGGIYSGSKPGSIDDPAAGGAARFAGISGVGVDARGNLYVGGGFHGTDLRQFRSDGSLGWRLHSLMFCNTYDVDPDSDGSELYGAYHHLHLDLSRNGAGQEQRYIAHSWDRRRFGRATRSGMSQAIVRRLGAARRLIMFTSAQGIVGDIHIYRYDGELAIPAGGTRNNGSVLWIDGNGDGLIAPAECAPMARPLNWVTSLSVDASGGIWATNSTTEGTFVRHFPLKAMNPAGAPVYSATPGSGYEDIRFPEEGDKTSAWGMASRFDYDLARDVAIAFYPAVGRTGDDDRSPAQYFMARYDRWSSGNRVPTWKVKAFTPQTHPGYFMYEQDLYPYSGYMGLQIAGDYAFFAYLFGEIHAFDLKTGALAQTFPHGPEVAGQCAWEDAAMGLRAFQRKNGEYLILTENSGWGGKNHLFRWKP